MKPTWASKLGKGVEIDTSLSTFNIAHVKVANPASSGQWDNLAGIMSSDPNVEAVEPNYLYHATASPTNDEYIDDLWHLNSVSAFKAWDRLPKQENGKDIIVAVVDTGIQLNHEDLKGHIWKNTKEIPGNLEDDDGNGYVDDLTGWNFHDNNQMPYSHLNPIPVASIDPDTGRFKCSGHPTKKDYEIHGTHVAGIIAAAQNNNIGVAGVYNRIKIMPLKALGGPCGYGDSKAILRAVLYAYVHGAKIINMSLGGYAHSEMAQRVYEFLSKEGVLVVAAAGNAQNNNDGRYKSYPASYPANGILSVAATDSQDHLAEFSNYGKRGVDLAAPGVKILSTAPRDIKKDWPQSNYIALSGTSMAAPVVSGAAAILLAQNPKLNNIQLKNMLMSGTDKLTNLKGKVLTGGRLNIAKALSQRTVVTKQKKNERTQRQEPTPEMQSSSGPASVGGIRIFDSRTGSEERMKW
ncbi:S8 family peptidase [Candidatus Terasakiella magnetica]|nr:S8 family peptidase [Candidatus Terasakiella magnetica]